MQTNKANRSPEHQADTMPAAKAALTPAPPALSQPSLSMAFRPAVPSLFLSDAEARAVHQSSNAAQSASPRPSEGGLSAALGERTIQETGSVAASAAASGTKRARDGKDGPTGKPSKAENHGKPKPFDKSLAHAGEDLNPNDAGNNAQPPGKRARKSTISTISTINTQSGKTHRPKSVDQGTSQTGALSPTAKAASAPPQLPDNALSGSDAVNPVTWKHGAQSPRANSGSRASLTLAPRRSSNASAYERTSPARQGENPVAGQQAEVNIGASATLSDFQSFTFSPCDSDEEGVICVESGSGPALLGKGAQAAPRAAQPAANPGPGPGPNTRPGTEPEGGAAPAQQQPARQQPGLTSDMTALLDDLDAALDKPIGM